MTGFCARLFHALFFFFFFLTHFLVRTWSLVAFFLVPRGRSTRSIWGNSSNASLKSRCPDAQMAPYGDEDSMEGEDSCKIAKHIYLHGLARKGISSAKSDTRPNRFEIPIVPNSCCSSSLDQIPGNQVEFCHL